MMTNNYNNNKVCAIQYYTYVIIINVDVNVSKMPKATFYVCVCAVKPYDALMSIYCDYYNFIVDKTSAHANEFLSAKAPVLACVS